MPQWGCQPPCICHHLSLTCTHSNLMHLLVASYAMTCVLSLGRREGKCHFLLTNPPTNSHTLTALLPCQHRILSNMRAANGNNGGQQRTAVEGMRDDRSRQQTMTKRLANDNKCEWQMTTKMSGKQQQM